MVTCYLRYVIDPDKVAEFENYAKMWIPLVDKFGGKHLGYFLPHEGPNNVAIALFSFPSLAAPAGDRGTMYPFTWAAARFARSRSSAAFRAVPRASRSSDSSRMMSSDSAAGTSALIRLGADGVSRARAVTIEIMSSPLNGSSPVHMRYRTTPRLKISQR